MKTNWKMMSAVLAAGAMLLATSCSESSSDDATPALGGEIASGQTLVGNVTSDAYLLKDGTYKLSGGLHVKSGATLHIAEGSPSRPSTMPWWTTSSWSRAAKSTPRVRLPSRL